MAASKENGPPSSPCRARQPQRDSARVPVLSPHKQSCVLVLHAASISSGPCVSVHARVCVLVSPNLEAPIQLSSSSFFPLSHPSNRRSHHIPPPLLCTSHCTGFPAFACGFQIPNSRFPAAWRRETGDWRLDLESRRTPGQPPAAVQHAGSSPSRRLSHSVDLGRQRAALPVCGAVESEQQSVSQSVACVSNKRQTASVCVVSTRPGPGALRSRSTPASGSQRLRLLSLTLS